MPADGQRDSSENHSVLAMQKKKLKAKSAPEIILLIVMLSVALATAFFLTCYFIWWPYNGYMSSYMKLIKDRQNADRHSIGRQSDNK